MAQDGNAAPTGAELAHTFRRRTVAIAVGSNLIGGVTALAFGIISPFPAEPDNESQLLLINLAVFVLVMGAGLWLGLTWARRAVGVPIERWLTEERPPTAEERDLVLRQPDPHGRDRGEPLGPRGAGLRGGERHRVGRAGCHARRW